MTTLTPRAPYSKEELQQLYPAGLQLQLVQVILRHGERSPVSARFQNAGLREYWPYCNAARRLRSAVMTAADAAGTGTAWDSLEWRRRLETFGADNGPALAASAGGQVDGICNMGELTDQGRSTTLALGKRLRHLYVDQLSFMPRLIASADMIYLRATPIPRALESVQEAFYGMYPKSARTMDFPAPTIITRTPADETLFPNDSNCRRFNQLSRAFAQRTADRWNNTSDMDHLNKLISKWMPEDSPRVAVDSHPRLSGIMDTVNSTLAHPSLTRLPKEFYDTKAREILDRVNVEEWFSGYKESTEYRQVGIGALAGDIVERMVGSAEHNNTIDGLAEIAGSKKEGVLDDKAAQDDEVIGRGGETAIKFCMSGAHDTTLAALLTAVGAFEGEKWPPYTSHVAFELFKTAPVPSATSPGSNSSGSSINETPATAVPGVRPNALAHPAGSALWSRIRRGGGSGGASDNPIARRPSTDLSEEERNRMDGYFVRIRYNDRILRVPGCAPAGRHLEGDDSFCTLAAFKQVVDNFTPRNWRQACVSNLDKSPFPEKIEPPGW